MEFMKINEGHQRVMAYLIVKDAGKFINFLQTIFNAEERFRVQRTEDIIKHAEVKIGDATIMLADATPEYPPAPASLYIYVQDADTTYHNALNAGASSVMEPFDESYGARAAGICDPFGNTWWLATLK